THHRLSSEFDTPSFWTHNVLSSLRERDKGRGSSTPAPLRSFLCLLLFLVSDLCFGVHADDRPTGPEPRSLDEFPRRNVEVLRGLNDRPLIGDRFGVPLGHQGVD